MRHKDIPAGDRLIFAMDVPDCDRARALADELGVGLQQIKVDAAHRARGGHLGFRLVLAARSNGDVRSFS